MTDISPSKFDYAALDMETRIVVQAKTERVKERMKRAIKPQSNIDRFIEADPYIEDTPSRTVVDEVDAVTAEVTPSTFIRTGAEEFKSGQRVQFGTRKGTVHGSTLSVVNVTFDDTGEITSIHPALLALEEASDGKIHIGSKVQYTDDVIGTKTGVVEEIYADQSARVDFDGVVGKYPLSTLSLATTTAVMEVPAVKLPVPNNDEEHKFFLRRLRANWSFPEGWVAPDVVKLSPEVWDQLTSAGWIESRQLPISNDIDSTSEVTCCRITDRGCAYIEEPHPVPEKATLKVYPPSTPAAETTQIPTLPELTLVQPTAPSIDALISLLTAAQDMALSLLEIHPARAYQLNSAIQQLASTTKLVRAVVEPLAQPSVIKFETPPSRIADMKPPGKALR